MLTLAGVVILIKRGIQHKPLSAGTYVEVATKEQAITALANALNLDAEELKEHIQQIAGEAVLSEQDYIEIYNRFVHRKGFILYNQAKSSANPYPLSTAVWERLDSNPFSLIIRPVIALPIRILEMVVRGFLSFFTQRIEARIDYYLESQQDGFLRGLYDN
jgi:hypothetical protein